MQEQRGREPASDQVAPVDRHVERIELAGVMEPVNDEGNEAENIKVPGLIRAAAAEVNEETDDQICGSDEILRSDGKAARRFANNDRDGYFDARAPDDVG